MEWKIINHKMDLPRDGSIFLSLWKGRICLTSFCKDEGRFYIMWDPSEYSQSMQVSQGREGKFTHWMELPKKPKIANKNIDQLRNEMSNLLIDMIQKKWSPKEE